MQTLYRTIDGNGYFPMPTLGYQAGGDDQIVAAVHSKLGMYTADEQMSLRIWGWKPDALRDEDRYHIDQLIRIFLYQEERILAALRRLDHDLAALRESSAETAEAIDAFTQSLYDRRATLVAEIEAAEEARYQKRVEEYREFGKRPPREIPPKDGEWFRLRAPAGAIIDLTDPEVARDLGHVASLARGGMSFGRCGMWRLKDVGYGSDRIPHDALRALVDLVLAVQAEYQLQSLLLDREFDRLIDTRGAEYDYLLAKAEAEKAASTGWGILGDILGIVSAVTGVLALIPVLAPIMGPVALITAAGSLAANTVDAVLKGDWDAATVVGLGADALGAIPFVGAVGKAAKAGKAAMKSVGKVSVATKSAGRAFLAASVKSSGDVGKIANYLGTRGAKLVGASAKNGKIAAKVLKGAVDLATQIPTAISLGVDDDAVDVAENTAAGLEIGHHTLNKVGDWVEMGAEMYRRNGRSSLRRLAGALA
ncbi:hypothetical protein [Actinokineospora enzanensis]|uniref:hypothetical protein n=1 Tax=Actinokineospora enzanensis TaxID=155975 RepID=UPI00037B4B33|nr:hypothetical protein [Actinokineospora enzanensis]